MLIGPAHYFSDDFDAITNNLQIDEQIVYGKVDHSEFLFLMHNLGLILRFPNRHVLAYSFLWLVAIATCIGKLW